MTEYFILQDLDVMIAVAIIVIHIIVSFYIFTKHKYVILLFISLIFSIIFAFGSFQYDIPFNPYLQLFDILINTMFFLYALGSKL